MVQEKNKGKINIITKSDHKMLEGNASKPNDEKLNTDTVMQGLKFMEWICPNRWT